MFESVRRAGRQVWRGVHRAIYILIASTIIATERLVGRGRKRHWMIGGCSGRAYTDNSASFHRYLRAHHPELEVYWVIDRRSPDVHSVRKLGPVLYMGSLGMYIQSLRAQVHVISHGIHDVPGCASVFARDSIRVRLGHGLTATGRTRGSRLRPVRARDRIFDLVPVASEFEKRNKLTWGFRPDKVIATGLPRFDDLLRLRDAGAAARVFETKQKILYMPTWRDWLPSDPKVWEEEFESHVVTFLTDSALLATLAERGVTIRFAVHPGMAERSPRLFDRVSSQWIQPTRSFSGIQKEIAECAMLMTDYSSIAWDALFLNKPVAFYQFDLDAYEKARGAYIDLRTELFGPVARTAEAASLTTREIVHNGFAVPEWAPVMRSWRERAFAFHDAQNCDRVFQAIQGCIERKVHGRIKNERPSE